MKLFEISEAQITQIEQAALDLNKQAAKTSLSVVSIALLQAICKTVRKQFYDVNASVTEYEARNQQKP